MPDHIPRQSLISLAYDAINFCGSMIVCLVQYMGGGFLVIETDLRKQKLDRNYFCYNVHRSKLFSCGLRGGTLVRKTVRRHTVILHKVKEKTILIYP